MTDPVAAFMRRERKALLRSAPKAAAAAPLWHLARRRRERRLRRWLRAAGWLVRVAVAATAVAAFAVARPEAHFLLFALAISAWLTRGACAPVGPSFEKETSS